MKQKQKTLLKKLKEMDSNSVPFFEAKQKLTDQGYSDVEISHALFEFSYDGKPNAVKTQNPTTKYYSQNPAEAKKIAEYMMQDMTQRQKGQQRSQASANLLASRFAPGRHARSVYSLRFADDIGFPFFTALFLTVVALIVTFKYDLPEIFGYSGVAVVMVYWVGKRLLSRL